jgi:photosystem II stability/assembly factor-like uncharacterized protein
MKKLVLIPFLFLLCFKSQAYKWQLWPTDTLQFVDLVFSDTNTAFGTVGDLRLYKTKDHGKSWKLINVVGKDSKYYRFGSFNFPTPKVGYLTMVENHFADSAYYNGTPQNIGVLRTDDSGETWHKVNNNEYVNFGTRIHFFDAKTGFAVTPSFTKAGQFLWQTKDSGVTWRYAFGVYRFTGFGFKPNGRMTMSMYYPIYCVPNDPSTYGCYKWGTELHTTKDSCNNFLNPRYYELDTNKIWSKIYYVTDSVGFMQEERFDVKGGKAILKTEDGGKSWKKVYEIQKVSLSQTNIFLPDLNDIYFSNSVNGFILTYWKENFIETKDGGITWQESALPNQQIGVKTVVDKNNQIYILTRQYKLPYLELLKHYVYTDTATKKVSIIPHEPKYESIKIYPNPFADKLNITLNSNSEYKLVISNMFGQVLFNDNSIKNTTNYIFKNDFINNGIYILTINDKTHNLIKTFKIIIN